MKLNENVKVVGEKVILVPYEPIHVAKYHDWMEDEEIRRLTGSERLTIEEEYEMQKSWRNDEDKLTFIVLSKELSSTTNDETACMIGDVNLFIDKDECSAEAEVMIAEPSARGKGAAQEALQLMISYALRNIGTKKFFVKITEDNEASLNLFEKKLSFHRVSHSKVFGEYTLELSGEKLPEFEHFVVDAVVELYKH